MKTTISTAASLLSVLALSSEVAGQRVVQLDIAKRASSPPTRLGKRQDFSDSIINNVTGGSYEIQTSLGTPAQSITLVLDTGSSDVWVLASDADQCTSAQLEYEYGFCSGGTFNPNASSTYKLVNTDFDIAYADGSETKGDYFTDTFALTGGHSITNQQMGLGIETSVGTGIMGIGYDTNEAASTEYPSVIDMMVSQGLIATKAYSLWLNDIEASTGSILFGGIDTAKYSGSLIAVPIQASSSGVITSFTVALSSVSSTISGTTTSLSTSTIPVVLDSGTTLTYLPDAATDAIYKAFNVQTDQDGDAFIDCSYATSSDTINYSFGGSGGPTIKVALSELVFDEGITGADFQGGQAPFAETCIFGLSSSGTSGTNLLGDTFLRSAYVVYDLSLNQIALAQTDFNATGSSVTEISASATRIPGVSSVVSAASVDATGSGRPGVGGIRTTSVLTNSAGDATATVVVVGQTASGTSSGTAVSSSKAAAGRVTVPGIDGSGLIVIGVAAFMAVLGGGWFVL